MPIPRGDVESVTLAGAPHHASNPARAISRRSRDRAGSSSEATIYVARGPHPARRSSRRDHRGESALRAVTIHCRSGCTPDSRRSRLRRPSRNCRALSENYWQKLLCRSGVECNRRTLPDICRVSADYRVIIQRATTQLAAPAICCSISDRGVDTSPDSAADSRLRYPDPASGDSEHTHPAPVA